jgi:integrase
MAIRKVYSNKRKPGWHWDEKNKRSWAWRIDMWLATGKRKKVSGFWSESEALAVMAKIREAERNAKFGFLNSLQQQPSLKQLCEARVKVIGNRHERIRAERVFGILMELLGQAIKVPEITKDMLGKFNVQRRKDGLQDQSIAREWNIIAAMFNSAREYFPNMKDWLPPGVPRPKGSRKKRRTRLLQPEEILKALTWLYAPRREKESLEYAWNRKTVGHALQTSLLTSARKGSLCVLKKTDVDFERKIVKITDVKNLTTAERPVRDVPMDESLINLFRERFEYWPHPYVFTRHGGEISRFYDIWKECAKATGINYGQNIAGGFRPHDARHTAATIFYRQSKDLTIVRGFTGHESDQLFVYLHEDEGEMREAQEAMNRYIAGKG